jgi:hypothetical protein
MQILRPYSLQMYSTRGARQHAYGLPSGLASCPLRDGFDPTARIETLTIQYLGSIVGALAAGALAKTGDIGGRVVTDTYDALRTLIIRKLGKIGAVQSVEDEPRSETARAALAEALTRPGSRLILSLRSSQKASVSSCGATITPDRVIRARRSATAGRGAIVL